MPTCVTCGFVAHPELPPQHQRELIRTIDEEGSDEMCTLCVMRLVGELRRMPFSLTLVLGERVEVPG